MSAFCAYAAWGTQRRPRPARAAFGLTLKQKRRSPLPARRREQCREGAHDELPPAALTPTGTPGSLGEVPFGYRVRMTSWSRTPAAAGTGRDVPRRQPSSARDRSRPRSTASRRRFDRRSKPRDEPSQPGLADPVRRRTFGRSAPGPQEVRNDPEMTRGNQHVSPGEPAFRTV